MVYAHIVPPEGTKEAVHAALKKIETLLSDKQYVAGTSFTIADLAVYASISLLEAVYPDMPSTPAGLGFESGDLKQMQRWYAEIADRDKVKEANVFFDEWKVTKRDEVKLVLEADGLATRLWTEIQNFMQAVFSAADRDGSGELDRQELRAAVHKVFRAMQAKIY